MLSFLLLFEILSWFHRGIAYSQGITIVRNLIWIKPNLALLSLYLVKGILYSLSLELENFLIRLGNRVVDIRLVVHERLNHLLHLLFFLFDAIMELKQFVFRIHFAFPPLNSLVSIALILTVVLVRNL